MAIDTAESKHRAIADRLASRVRRGAYRSKIPGERALADEFGVNFKTANRAVGLLVDEGLLVRRRGQGTFVVRHVSTERTRLALAFYKYNPAEPDPIYAQLFASATTAARAAECQIELFMPGLTQAPEALAVDARLDHYRGLFLDDIAATRPEGVLYCGNPDKTVLVELASLAPVLQVSKFGFPGESYVCRDPANGVARAITQLAGAGRKRIAYASYEHENAIDEAKADAYRATLDELGLEFRREIAATYYAKPDLASELLGDDPADGVICSESTIGRSMLTGLAERGISVPGDVALWSFDDGATGEYTNPAMSGIRLFGGDLGELAVAKLVEMIEGTAELPVRQMLPALLELRESSRSGEEIA